MSELKNFDLRHMEIFLAVLDTASMARAGARMGISQAAVSQAIQRLETSLATQLIDRSSRPVRATTAGTLLASSAREILGRVRQSHADLRGLGEISMPELRIACVNSFAGAVMPEVLTRLRDAFGSNRIALLSGIARSTVAALTEGRVDTIVTSDAVDEAVGYPLFPILEEEFLIATPRAVTPLDQLEDMARGGLPYVGYSATCVIGRLLRVQFNRHRLELQGEAVFDDSRLLMDTVADGQGWTVTTPLCLLEARVDPKAIAVRPLGRKLSPRRLCLITRPHEQSSLQKRLAQVMIDTARDTIPGKLRPFGPGLIDQIAFAPSFVSEP